MALTPLMTSSVAGIASVQDMVLTMPWAVSSQSLMMALLVVFQVKSLDGVTALTASLVRMMQLPRHSMWLQSIMETQCFFTKLG